MADFLILKQEHWQHGTVVQADTAAELRELVKQGFKGADLYAIVRWDTRREYDLGPGPPEVRDVP